MSQAWYRVASMSYGYAGAVILALIVLLALRCHMRDRALWRRVRRDVPQVGAAGALRVVNAGRAHLKSGEDIPLPYEGTLGSAHSCDVRIPKRRVHLRSAFFWVERGELHVVSLHRDGFEADGVELEPGDEAVMRDGAVLSAGDMRLALRLSRAASRAGHEEPYVTAARRSRAQQGHGEGIGRPGKGEARRERRLREDADASPRRGAKQAEPKSAAKRGRGSKADKPDKANKADKASKADKAEKAAGRAAAKDREQSARREKRPAARETDGKRRRR